MRRFALLIFMIIAGKSVFAQTDTAFWFAAPDISSGFNYDRPIYLRITASQLPSTVTISQPAGGGFPTQVISIPANTLQTVDLTPWINSIECAPGNVIQNKGIKIVSDNKISVYYELNANGVNPELFALKGRNALGNLFYISSQYILNNVAVINPLAYSSFNIVATEDNTTVTINPAKNIVGHAAGSPFTITLNKGQTYAAIATSQAAAQHLHGSIVTATKPIAITLADDLLQGIAYGGICEDLGGDQTIPVNIIGTEYIAIKSNLNTPFDKVYITATQNGTTISQDGVIVTTLNTGQSTELTVTNNSTYIQSSAPVYAYQLSGIGCEVGTAVLPQITCTGSSSVSVARSTNESFIATLLVKNGGQNSFLVNNASGIITAANFSVVPGTAGVWYHAKVTLPIGAYPNGSVIRISNPDMIFHLGVLQGGVLSGVAFGYFSDYNSIKATASTTTATPCIGSDILLAAETVSSASYSWTGPNSFTSIVQNPTLNNASLLNSGKYYLTITVPGCGSYKDSVMVNVRNCRNDIGNIINDYTPILSLNTCENKITVEDATAFNMGDTVLMIQMKGAIIDSTNTTAFGTITDYKGAGNYEFNYVKSKSGNIIELKNTIIRQFDIPIGKVQLIRVPYYDDVTVTSTLTCLPWDGSKGGVLVLNVADSVTLQTNIDVSGRGFRGGTGFNSQTATLNCFENNYFYPQSSNAIAGEKGESIASPSFNINYGKGNAAGGGGGGLGHNSGGGGGGNAGTGGFGGYSLDACGNAPFDNRGIGGRSFAYSTAANKIFAGSGGGAGQADNPGNPAPAGGNGGGISIILANKLITNGNKIISNGSNASTCAIPPSTDCHDAMGGGGAAGTILISVNQLLDNTAVENKGGKGADMVGSVALGGKIGAGGGGSGGLLFVKQATLPAVITNVNTGGANGVLTRDANNAWGATPGQSGSTLFNLNIPFTTIAFKPNIDSVRIKDSATSCNSYDFKGLGYTNTNPVATWQWNFGDGNTATAQNPSHSYATAGSFPVKLIITDINGCKDSITKNVMSSFLTLNAGPADTICITNSTVLQASQTGGNQFAWTPAAFLNDPTLLNPTATPPVTTKFYLTVTNTMGCSRKDSVTIDVRSPNGFSITTPPGVCKNDSAQLNAGGGDVYTWQPANTLSDPNIPNPKASPATTATYTVQIIDNLCGFSTSLSTIVTILPLPTIRTSKSNDITCTIAESKLLATGANIYTWSPGATLNTTTGSSPIAHPLITTQYIVNGTNSNGCTNQDSITVKVTTENPLNYQMPTGFTPNNDGLNDCFGIKYWGNVSEIEFSVFNRWGQRVFYSKKVGDCWNGMHNGLLQDTGVFVYMIKAKTGCDPVVFRKGTFVLIR